MKIFINVHGSLILWRQAAFRDFQKKNA